MKVSKPAFSSRRLQLRSISVPRCVNLWICSSVVTLQLDVEHLKDVTSPVPSFLLLSRFRSLCPPLIFPPVLSRDGDDVDSIYISCLQLALCRCSLPPPPFEPCRTQPHTCPLKDPTRAARYDLRLFSRGEMSATTSCSLTSPWKHFSQETLHVQSVGEQKGDFSRERTPHVYHFMCTCNAADASVSPRSCVGSPSVWVRSLPVVPWGPRS